MSVKNPESAQMKPFVNAFLGTPQNITFKAFSEVCQIGYKTYAIQNFLKVVKFALKINHFGLFLPFLRLK
jgi:hypothetical protein